MTERHDSGLRDEAALKCGIGLAILIAAVIAGWLPTLLFWFVVGWAIGIVVHELGHAACAAVVSIPVYRIVVGDGPLLWRRRIGHAAIDVRIVPQGGYVLPYPSLNDRGWRRALFNAGGTLANLAVIGLVRAVHLHGVPDRVGDVLDVVMLAQMIMIMINLAPIRTRSVVSDGLLLLRLLWRPAAHDHRATLRAALNAWDLPVTPSALRLLFHSQRLGSDADALDDLKRELEGGELSPAERATALDTLVTRGLVTGDPMLRPHLDAWSAQLVALEPDRPTRQGSRGSVLVELGRYREGKALLAPLAGPDQPALDAFMSRAWIAFAEGRLGNTATAQEFADAARATAAGVFPPTAAAVLARLDREFPPTPDAPKEQP